jgi:hypothetical protein
MAYLGPCCGNFPQFTMINAAQSSGCIGFRLGLKTRVSVVQFHPWPFSIKDLMSCRNGSPSNIVGGEQ